MAEAVIADRVAPRRSRRGRGGSRATGGMGFAALAVVPTVAILGLLAIVLWMSVRVSPDGGGWTLRHYSDIFTDPMASQAVWNTVGFTIVSTLTALAIGLPLAWIVERTDLKGKAIVYTLSTVGVFIPGFFSAMGWLLFAHPRIGMLNHWLRDWFGIDHAPFDVLTVPGMGFVQGFGLAGLVFVFTATSLRSMDGTLEEAAAMSGGGTLSVLRRVTLPLAYPGILAAVIFVITLSLAAFDVPLLIGLPNRIYLFSTVLVTLTGATDEGVGQYGLIAAFGALMIGVALVLTRSYRRMAERARSYAVVTGKASGRRLVHLGRGGRIAAYAFLVGYFGLAQLMPLVLLGWTAFQPYFEPISADGFGRLTTRNFHDLPWDLVRRGAGNSLLIMVLVPLITLLLSLAISWVVLRTRNRARALFDFAAFLPVAVPSLVFAFAALITVLNVDLPFGIQLYGSVALLIAMYSLVSLGFGTRTTTTALIQIHTDLEEAAKISGASHLTTMRRVVVPLLLPTLMYAALWIALLVSRDITLANVLFARDNLTIPMVVWTTWSSGQLGRASALSLLMMAFFVPLIFLYLRRAGGRVAP